MPDCEIIRYNQGGSGGGSATLPQPLATTDSPTFVGATYTGLTANRLVRTNGSKQLASATFDSDKVPYAFYALDTLVAAGDVTETVLSTFNVPAGTFVNDGDTMIIFANLVTLPSDPSPVNFVVGTKFVLPAGTETFTPNFQDEAQISVKVVITSSSALSGLLVGFEFSGVDANGSFVAPNAVSYILNRATEAFDIAFVGSNDTSTDNQILLFIESAVLYPVGA